MEKLTKEELDALSIVIGQRQEDLAMMSDSFTIIFLNLIKKHTML